MTSLVSLALLASRHLPPSLLLTSPLPPPSPPPPGQSVHQALGFLLSNDPKRLFAACPAWASFPKASMAEAQAKKRCKQLQVAYSSM